MEERPRLGWHSTGWISRSDEEMDWWDDRDEKLENSASHISNTMERHWRERAQCLHRCFWKGLWMVRLIENHNRQELSVFADASGKAYGWYVYLKTTTDKSSVSSPMLLKRPMDGASTWKPQQTRAQCLHRCFWKGLWMVRLLENLNRKELSVFTDASERPMDGTSSWKPQRTRAQCLHRCFWKGLWMVRLLENHNRQELSVFADASEKAYW